MKSLDGISANNGVATEKHPEDSTCKESKCPGWLQVNKPLIPLKIVLVCWFAGFSSLLPFVSVHLRERGLSVGETSAIYTFLPIPQLLAPPLAGIVADKIGRYKPVLLFSLVMCIAIATGILFIPKIPPEVCPHPAARLLCSVSLLPQLTVSEGKCDPSYNDTVHLDIVRCNLECRQPPWTGKSEKNTTTTELCFFGADSGRVCESIDLNTTTITEMNNLTLVALVTASQDLQQQQSTMCNYEVRSLVWNDTRTSFDQCFQSLHRQQDHFNCSLYCEVRDSTNLSDSGSLFKNHCEEHYNKRIPSVATAFVLILTFQVFLTICFRFLDVSALVMAKDHNSDFGRQRMWATMSTTIFAPLSGYLIDVISKQKGHTDYLPAFYFFNTLTALTGVMVVILNLKIAAPGKNLWRKSVTLLRNPEAVLFVMAIFCLGTMWGFIETFLPWFLVDLNSPKYVIGLTTTVGGVVALPFLLTSEWWFKKLGRVNIIIIAFFVYLVRCFGYSFLTNPWWSLLFESLKVFCYYLMWVSAVTYSCSLSPPGLLATVQGFIGGLHFGIGRGSGSLIGGNIMSRFGSRIAFRSMGIACGAAGFVYAGIYYFVILRIKRRNQNLDSDGTTVDKKPSKQQEAEQQTSNHPQPISVVGMVEKSPDGAEGSSNQFNKLADMAAASMTHTHL